MDPGHYEYELQDDSSYLVKLDTYNLEFSNSRVVEWLYAFELDKRTARGGCGNAVLINAAGIENPVIAVQEMSKSNLKNLKDIYGDNIKIYLIKYKPEKTYRVGADERDFSFEYLDARASEVYETKNAEELKEKFEMIWEDLREWTGYQEAKVVD